MEVGQPANPSSNSSPWDFVLEHHKWASSRWVEWALEGLQAQQAQGHTKASATEAMQAQACKDLIHQEAVSMRAPSRAGLVAFSKEAQALTKANHREASLEGPRRGGHSSHPCQTKPQAPAHTSHLGKCGHREEPLLSEASG